ncbi:MAG TPA: KTSC domain-containing protein [Thermoanaerobaculia bacterium]|jgi:hypothetical protein|nr:KTSC domain-containing protein [Thermoanaerobaculia bacterium]
MRRTPVASSAISSVGYDERKSMLEVEFQSGAVYEYFDVPPKVWRELQAADSKGRFLSRRIRDRYRFERR